MIKIEEHLFEGKFIYNKKEYICKNSINKRLIDQIDYVDIDENIAYIDADKAIKILDYYLRQENFEELIEQNEVREFNEKEIQDINYIVGRDYEQISLYEITDIEGFGTIPYFVVSEADNQYDSRRMGLGEYFLFYTFWRLLNTKNDSYVIIEEPETFVGIRSQQGIMNLVARLAAKNGCSFLIITHSPYILDKVNNENVSIIARASGIVSVCSPENGINIGSYLGYKDLIEGTFFVEDKLAALFLECLLETETPNLRKKYNVEIAGSNSEITCCLKFKCTDKIKYHIIGIYDGDQKGKIEEDKEIQWPYTFLPVNQDIEAAIIDFLKASGNIEMFAKNLEKKLEILTMALSMVSGKDKHDKILDIISYIAVDKKFFIKKFYNLWRVQNIERINQFVDSLHKLVKDKNI